jgi:tripartite-type tricarboxylate transporter receptor subunit TctC
MNRNRTHVLQAAVAALGTACTLAGSPALAQAWPAKPVRIIVAFPPGSSTDIVARVVGERLTEIWGHNVIVENRPGASGTVAAEWLRRQPADGTTLLLAAPPVTLVGSA